MSGKGNRKISAWFISTYNEQYFQSKSSRYANADLKICQYLRFHMKIILKISRSNILLLFEIFTHEKCEKFVCKHSETIEYVEKLAYFQRNLQTSRVNNSGMIQIKNAKFSWYCFSRCVFIWRQMYREIFKSASAYL